MKANEGAGLRRWLIGAGLVAFGAVLALAMQWKLAPRREPAVSAPTSAPPAGTSYAPFTLKAPRPAFSVEEEAYAAALWPIHSEVKDHAVKMIFAGLAFKTKEADAAATKAKLLPVQAGFAGIAARLAALQAPASFAAHQRNYVKAIELYRQSVAQMVKAADDSDEALLPGAQEQSHEAGQLLLKIGNTLWPTEYKPN